MHQRNRYRTRPDYKRLAIAYPALAPHLNATGNLDFKDEQAVRVLNQALLQVDFDLEVHLPWGNLCPTVGNRLDYLHLIEDLLGKGDASSQESPLFALDIGTGASCIYPLLGCRLHPYWRFVATEIDPVSADVACQNVLANGLSSRITVLPVASQEIPLLACIEASEWDFAFCMCNPPFYSSVADIAARQALKQTVATSSLDYTLSESVYPGGEVAFVARIVAESVRLGGRCRWYTSLLGLKSSVATLRSELQQASASQIKIMPLQAGRTRRWVLAWSFWGRNSERKRPASPERRRRRTLEMIIDEQHLDAKLASLQIAKAHDDRWTVHRITWGRHARRQLSRGKEPSPLDQPLTFVIQRTGNHARFILLDDGTKAWNHLVSLVNHIRQSPGLGVSPCPATRATTDISSTSPQ